MEKIFTADIEGPFSLYVFPQRRARKATLSERTKSIVPDDYFLVPKSALVSPSIIFGVNRTRNDRHTITLTFPEVVEWDKVTLKMKEGLRDVEIFYDGKFIQSADYSQLGFFSGKKQRKPDRQWGFLSALSVLSATDIKLATADKMRNMVAVNSKAALSTGNVHQIKRTLVKRLRTLFRTDDDPFHDRRDYYHPKFTILPEPDLRREEIWMQGGKLNDNRQYDETDTAE